MPRLFKHDNDLAVPTSHGQVGQDLFVIAMTHGARNGSFLEIGAGEPVYGNNTYVLEKQYGYRGISVEMVTPDSDKFFTKWYHEIRQPTWPASDFRLNTLPAWLRAELELKWSLEDWAKYHDAAAQTQREELGSRWKHERPDCNLITRDAFLIDYTSLPKFFTYLQIDIEPPEDNLSILQLICKHIRFSVITFEHDCYLDTPGSRKALSQSRLFLQRQGYTMVAGRVENFEDWWIDPAHISRNIYSHYLQTDDTVKTVGSVLFTMR
jgi:hypothetical protein